MLYVKSAGLAASATALAQNPKSAEGLEDAKLFLSSPTRDKIALLDTLNKQPDYLHQLLENCVVVLRAGFHTSAEKGGDVSRWLSMISAIEQAQTE